MMNQAQSHNTDIIDRYVFAVTKRLPRAQRADIKKELHGLIDDMLTERCPDCEPSSQDIDAVLIELGAPERLAARYTDQKRYIIGPEYYDTYRFVIVLAASCAAFGLTIAYSILFFLAPPAQANVFSHLADYAGALYIALLQVFAFVTVAFILAEHFNKKHNEGTVSANWYPNLLPPLPKAVREIKKGDAIASIVFGALVILLFNTAPQLMGAYTFQSQFHIVPVFDLVYLKSVMLLFNLCFIMGIVRETAKLIIGRYTVRLAVITALLDAASLAITVVIMRSPALWNANFVSELRQAGLAPSDFDISMFWSWFTNLFIGVFVLAFILDSGTMIVRTVKAQRDDAQ
ncbi:MAG: hypothetical protein ACERKO_10410 [Acetanaerobacterium sp.]